MEHWQTVTCLAKAASRCTGPIACVKLVAAHSLVIQANIVESSVIPGNQSHSSSATIAPVGSQAPMSVCKNTVQHSSL